MRSDLGAGPQTITFTSLEPLPSIVVCPKLYTNPTYNPVSSLPRNYTWGCPPAYLCEPAKVGCDIWEAPPDRGYICDPSDCQPVTPLNSPQMWGPNITSNATGNYTLQDDYFNLDPENFGLNFSIFVQETVVVQVENPPNKHKRGAARSFLSRFMKRAQTAPPACFADCNACELEAESSGKTPALCSPHSAFFSAVGSCRDCISLHAGSQSPIFQSIVQPDIQQFLDFCSGSEVSMNALSSTASLQPQSEISGSLTTGPSAVMASPARTEQSTTSKISASTASKMSTTSISSTTNPTSASNGNSQTSITSASTETSTTSAVSTRSSYSSTSGRTSSTGALESTTSATTASTATSSTSSSATTSNSASSPTSSRTRPTSKSTGTSTTSTSASHPTSRGTTSAIATTTSSSGSKGRSIKLWNLGSVLIGGMFWLIM
ncbi:MAG: hypothetical protein M1819_003208 [Sarea resinae]|nr:MAG: hypothetical protein M1819_003208 [Sarea resinae]